MIRVALDLDRAAVDRGHDQRHRPGPPRHRGRVVEELAWDDPFRALRERHKMHLRFAAATQAEPGERHRGAHELEKAAARNFVAFDLLRARGKFPLEPAAEFRRVAELTDAPPILFPGQIGRGMLEDAFHRWHP